MTKFVWKDSFLPAGLSGQGRDSSLLSEKVERLEIKSERLSTSGEGRRLGPGQDFLVRNTPLFSEPAEQSERGIQLF